MTQFLPHWLTRQAALSPNKTAIELTNDEKISFLQLKTKSEVFARKIASLGIEKGTKVAILSPNSLEMIIAIYALSYLQAVAVLLNIRLSKEELAYQLEQSETSLLLTTEQLRREKNIHFPIQHTFNEINNFEAFTELELMKEIDLKAPFTMMFTSGTTGLPKGVVHTYGNHWWSAISSVLNLGLNDHDKWLLTLPIFHVGGLSILLRSVIYGISVFLMERYNVYEMYKAFTDKNVTIASLVTVMLHQLLDTVGEKEFPSNVRCILLGGGSVPESLLARVEKNNVPLFQTYGMTETSSQIVTLSAAFARKKLGSAGKPLFSATVKIMNKQEDGIGEIFVKGPMVISGYVNNEEVNNNSFEGEWFRTGDLGYFDEDGFLYVVDRRTDLIISGGENIYPSEVENVLLQMKGVKEVAVVGAPDKIWGQVPVAFIVCEENMSEEEVIRFAKHVLASYKVPRKILFMDSLPRNASNKIMRHRLMESL